MGREVGSLHHNTRCSVAFPDPELITSSRGFLQRALPSAVSTHAGPGQGRVWGRCAVTHLNGRTLLWLLLYRLQLHQPGRGVGCDSVGDTRLCRLGCRGVTLSTAQCSVPILSVISMLLVMPRSRTSIVQREPVHGVAPGPDGPLCEEGNSVLLVETVLGPHIWHGGLVRIRGGLHQKHLVG